MDLSKVRARATEFSEYLSADQIGSLFAMPSRDSIDTYLKEYMFAQFDHLKVMRSFAGHTPKELAQELAGNLAIHHDQKQLARLNKLKTSFHTGFDYELMSLFFANPLNVQHPGVLQNLGTPEQELFSSRCFEVAFPKQSPFFKIKNSLKYKSIAKQNAELAANNPKVKFYFDLIDEAHKRKLYLGDYIRDAFLDALNAPEELSISIRFMERGLNCFTDELSLDFPEECRNARISHGYTTASLCNFRNGDLPGGSPFGKAISGAELPAKTRDIWQKYYGLMIKKDTLEPDDYTRKAAEIYADMQTIQPYYDGNKRTAQHIFQKLLIHKNIVPPPISANTLSVELKNALFRAFNDANYKEIGDFILAQVHTTRENTRSALQKYISMDIAYEPNQEKPYYKK